jgi:hypothetical protein
MSGTCDKCGNQCVSNRCWRCATTVGDSVPSVDPDDLARFRAIEKAAYDLRDSVSSLDETAKKVPMRSFSQLCNALDALDV